MTMMKRPFRLGLALALGLGLGGCSLLASDPPQLYDLSPKNTFEEGAPVVGWQLVVEEPTTPNAINTDRIAIRPAQLEVQYFPGVKWTDRAPALVQTLLVESFENSGKIVGVGRRSIGLSGDYILTSELREFEAVSSAGGGANVVVRLVLKLVRQSSGGIIASTTASATIQAASDSVPDVVAAFDQALGKVLKQSVGWVLRQGAADRKRYIEE
ncbi:MAG: ABC-type transport auxiliary lipoprotein family protein [Micropepsaceae bacterium]